MLQLIANTAIVAKPQALAAVHRNRFVQNGSLFYKNTVSCTKQMKHSISMPSLAFQALQPLQENRVKTETQTPLEKPQLQSTHY